MRLVCHFRRLTFDGDGSVDNLGRGQPVVDDLDGLYGREEEEEEKEEQHGVVLKVGTGTL